MAANPNNVNYVLGGGTVLPRWVLGSVTEGTGAVDYFERGGTIVFQAAIQPVVTSTAGIIPVLGLY